MHGAVFIGHFAKRRRGSGLVEQGVDFAGGIGIEHEDQLAVGARVAKQIQAVLLGAGKGALVPMHNVGAVILHCAQSDEAFADQALAGVGEGELLEVGIRCRARRPAPECRWRSKRPDKPAARV